MPENPEDRRRVLIRVRRIRGQCEAIERAVETGAGCASVLQQIAAARGAINGLMAEVLETHIREEFTSRTAEDEERVRDLLTLVRSYMK